MRGQAELDAVDGIPDEYFQWNGTCEMTLEQRAEWRSACGRSTTAWSGSW
jgi:hypothetical protein